MYENDDMEYFLLGVIVGGSRNVFVGGNKGTSNITARYDAEGNAIKVEVIGGEADDKS